MKKRIGIFGGSFDPVHHGHLQIASSFLNSKLVHQLLILPAPTPPHKTGRKLTPFIHRLKMLEIAFNGWENIIVSDLENRLKEKSVRKIMNENTKTEETSVPSYSIQTITYLQEKYPRKKWFLCIGEDSLLTFHKWYQYEKILEKVTLLVAERPGSNSQNVEAKILENTIFIGHEPVDISSTEFRNLRDGKLIPDEVLDYIQSKNLYKNNN